MKPPFYFLFILFFSACKKDPGGNGQGLPYTAIPGSEKVNSTLVAYITNSGTQYTNPAIVSSTTSTDPSIANYTYNNILLNYTLNNVHTEKYSTIVLAKRDDIFNTYKTFAVSDAVRNYVNIVPPILAYNGGYDPTQPGVFALPNGGFLSLPGYAFWGATDIPKVTLYSAYLNPAIGDYAASLPCYPMADDGGKRWFLNSYGVYGFIPIGNAWVYLDFKSGTDIKLQMPIPSNLISSAPDSIQAYSINGAGNSWIKKGYAYKSNNTYVMKIDEKGFWNFAIPSPGVYLTLHLHTSNDMPVPNTRIKIKSGINEVSDVRTDAEGNAIIFVPTNTSLTVDISGSQLTSYSSAQASNLPLGSFSRSGETTLKLPDLFEMETLDSKVYNCDGSLMKSGMALLRYTGDLKGQKEDYLIPVLNGKMNVAVWLDWGYEPADLVIMNDAGDTLNTTNIVLGGVGGRGSNSIVLHYRPNFYNCKDEEKVYCNYTIDNTAYSLSADANAPGSIFSETWDPGSSNVITISSAGKGIAFVCNGSGVMGNWFLPIPTSSMPTSLLINGENCTYDDTQYSSELLITRVDPKIGGFVEGRFSIIYKDSKSGSHRVLGDFRVIRNF